MSGLFSTFNVAKRGMEVQQKAIDVTAHNISNANTEGYSRQRAIIETSRPFGMPTINNVAEAGQLGTGSLISSIARVRDNFLDYQIRVETSTQGQFQARDASLSKVEKIFNEPSDSGLSSLLGKFYQAWNNLSLQPQSSNARTVVAQQSSALADALNHNYTQLIKLKENTQSEIKNTVYDVNNILNQVDQLNQQIVGVQVSGSQPNDLMDKRDLLLDTLSSKFNINIDKQNFSGYDVKPLVEVDSAGVTTAPTNALLVRTLTNSDVRRFSYISSIVPNPAGSTNYDVTYYKNGDMSNASNAVTINIIGDANTFKTLDETRVLWADKDGNALATGDVIATSGMTLSDLKIFKPVSGEIKGYMTVQQDLDDYVGQMNNVAKALAFSINAIHSANPTTNASGGITNDNMPFFVNSSTAQYNLSNKMTNLPGILSAEQDITAANISVNKEIMSDVMNINVKTDTTSGDTDGKRALAIAQLRDSLIKIQDIGTVINNRADLLAQNTISSDSLSLLNNKDGTTVGNYFKDLINKVGIQEQEAKRMVTNQESLLGGFMETRDSVSGVSLDEEMANLVQFQHAYQANAKIISTIDQLLDVVINGLKR